MAFERAIDIRMGCLIQVAATMIWLVPLDLCTAQDAPKAQLSRPSAGWSSSWQFGGRTQAATRLSGGGRFGVSQFGFNASLGYQEQPSNRIAFSLSYQQRAYEFQSLGRWMEAQPWEHVHFLSLSLPIRRPLTPDWSMMFIPTLRTMVEDLSDADQNLTGGAIVGFSRQISPKLKLGPGWSTHATKTIQVLSGYCGRLGPIGPMEAQHRAGCWCFARTRFDLVLRLECLVGFPAFRSL